MGCSQSNTEIDEIQRVRKKQEQENRMIVINRTIDKIWAKYDIDKNGSLQRDEVKIFVTDKI